MNGTSGRGYWGGPRQQEEEPWGPVMEVLVQPDCEVVWAAGPCEQAEIV